MPWHKAYDSIKPYMVRIETETGFGTGFLFGYTENHTLAAFATACHVVEDVDDWKKPLRIRHYTTGDVVYFEDEKRVVLLDRDRDTATILVHATSFNLPPATLALLPSDKFKKIGIPVAWTGFPRLSPADLCFFTGTVSFYKQAYDSYLIDGVAINGVSGGPVFSMLQDSTPQIVGVISSYVANRRGGDSLPGLLKAQDLTTIHKHISTIKSLDDAKQKEEQLQDKVSQDSTPPEPAAKESVEPPTEAPPSKKKVAKKKATKKAASKKVAKKKTPSKKKAARKN